LRIDVSFTATSKESNVNTANTAKLSTATQINTLTDQIALVNQHMANSATLEGQPAELLDRRDLLLRKLSDLVRIKTSFTTNGTVNVALGNSATQCVVVNGQKSRPIGVDKSTP
jgi:flagellar hook-associated protein 1 FlgK